MKKLLFFLFVIGMMTMNAQESMTFIDEDGYEVKYSTAFLAESIAASDTLLGEDEFLLAEYESVFPPQRGSHEPAILVLLPDVNEFYVIVIQENKRGKILALRILTRDGWIEADEESLLIAKNLF